MDSLEEYDPNNWIDIPVEEMMLNPIGYSNLGLYKSLKELGKAYPAVLYISIEEQMTYADAIARRYSKNPHFLEKFRDMISPEHDEEALRKANTTTVGNAAVLAYHNGMDSEWGKYYTRITNLLKSGQVWGL